MNDKVKHIIAGLAAALIVALPVWLDCNNLFAGLWACLSGIIAGAVKEWCDNEYGIGWNWRDLGWTIVGSVVAMLLIVLMHFAKG